MAKYSPTWNLETIPHDVFMSEYGRRSQAKRVTFTGGRKPSCNCGACITCIRREQMREWRSRKQISRKSL